jgi:hypothetical protein
MFEYSENNPNHPVVVSLDRSIDIEEMYEGRHLPDKSEGPAIPWIFAQEIEQMRQANLPETLCSREDAELANIGAHAYDLLRFMSCKKENLDLQRILDFESDEESICLGPGGQMYSVRKISLNDIKIRRKLGTLLVKNWLRKYPTSQWYIEEETGELIDLHRMQKIIEERKKQMLVKYPDNLPR